MFENTTNVLMAARNHARVITGFLLAALLFSGPVLVQNPSFMQAPVIS
jgi:hypothetical protein